jgi:hypothetical protein
VDQHLDRRLARFTRFPQGLRAIENHAPLAFARLVAVAFETVIPQDGENLPFEVGCPVGRLVFGLAQQGESQPKQGGGHAGFLVR